MTWQESFLNFVRPFVEWIGKRHWPFTRKKTTGKHYYLWRDMITPGCVLLCTTQGEFSNFFNPTKIKHAALYVGYTYHKDLNANIPSVVEATSKGVVLTDLVTFLTTKDYVVGLKPAFKVHEQALRGHAFKKVGWPYDYAFKKGNKAYYCYELVAELFMLMNKNLRFRSGEYLGYNVYDQDTFLKDPQFVEVFRNMPNG